MPHTNIEIVIADWTLAKRLLTQIEFDMRRSLAGQVCLGAELQQIKRDLGFEGRGRKKNSANVAELKTWSEWLSQEMPGLPERTANRFISIYEGAKAKHKKLGQAKALNLFDYPNDELSADQRQQLQDLTSKITDGETQSSLLKELKIAKSPQGSAAQGGLLIKKETPQENGQSEDSDNMDGSDGSQPMQQLAFALFTHPVQELCKLRANSDYITSLHSLPLTSSDETEVSLNALEIQASSFLADIQTAKEAAKRDALEIV